MYTSLAKKKKGHLCDLHTLSMRFSVLLMSLYTEKTKKGTDVLLNE